MITKQIVTKREIQTAIDGTNFSDYATLEYQDDNGQIIRFYMNPDAIYDIAKETIIKSVPISEVNMENLTKEQAIIKKQVVRTMRAALKGVLLTCGDMLLTMFLGDSHEKPPRAKRGEKIDIIDWYIDMFAKISISYLMKNDILLKGASNETNPEPARAFTIYEVTTRPVTGESK